MKDSLFVNNPIAKISTGGVSNVVHISYTYEARIFLIASVILEAHERALGGRCTHFLGFLVGASLDLLSSEIVVAVLVHLNRCHRRPVLALVETATEPFSSLGIVRVIKSRALLLNRLDSIHVY